MIKAVIFDFDGTIADDFKISIDCIKKIEKNKHQKINKGFDKYRNHGLLELIKHSGWDAFRLPFLVKQCQVMMETPEVMKKIKAFPGIKKVIDQLSNNYKIFIVSSNSEAVVKKFIKRHRIKAHSIMCNASFIRKQGKLKKILRKHKLKVEEAIYIADETRDINACKSIGLRMIAVSWGYTSKKRLKQEDPTYLIHKPKEILEILQPSIVVK